MKYSLNKVESTKLKKLFDTMDVNITMGQIYSDFISYQNPSKESLSPYFAKGKTKVDALYNYYLDLLDIDGNDGGIKNLFNRTKFKSIVLLNNETYDSNSYSNTIKTDNIKDLSWKFLNDFYRPFEVFIYQDTSVEENDYYLEINHLGYFENKYSFLSVEQNNIPWMTVTPNEIETMKEPIANANGKVVTFGLGLGYFAFMASNKDEVNEVTIVESDKKIIELFKRYILPQFPHKEKIHIVNQDAFAFLKTNKENYDYAFIDTYHTAEDGIEMYCHFKTFEKDYPNTKFEYWIEDSIIALFRRAFISMIEEEFSSSKVDYSLQRDFIDRLVNNLHNLYQDKLITTYEEIHTLLSKDNIISLASKIY